MQKIFDLLPTPLNAANDISPSGFYNARTYQQTNAGGLVLGDYIDLDDAEAANQSATNIGLLFQGRYRRVKIADNATALNVAKGKAAYVIPGTSLVQVVVLTAGTGQNPGFYQVVGTGGGGTGAIIGVVVGAAGTVTTAPIVVAGGEGYTSAPTFTLVSGGTPATFQPQMKLNSYVVTTRDVAGVNLSQPRGVFLNTITPGNYGWIQENGIATVLQTGTVGSATAGAVVTSLTPTDGTFQTVIATTPALPSAFGTAVDVAIANGYYRTVLTLPVWNG
ncbi:MAG TPA: hypothetical protein VK638_06340 [Edaphobacter sp.]|nr:hypothetical protein [Edaphobacter sp.]